MEISKRLELVVISVPSGFFQMKESMPAEILLVRTKRLLRQTGLLENGVGVAGLGSTETMTQREENDIRLQ